VARLRRLDRDPAILQRFEILGLSPRQYKPLVMEVMKWVDNWGEETTVRRLKDIRNMFLHYLAGLPIDRSLWIATHRDGRPKGPFKILFVKGTRCRKLTAIWNVLMMYSHFEGERITKKQWAKFTKGVVRASPNEEAISDVKRFITLGLESMKRKLNVDPPECRGDPVIAYIGSDTRRAPLGTTMSSGTAPEKETILKGIESFAHGYAMQIAPNILDGTLKGTFEYYNSYVQTLMENGISPISLPPVIGRIALLQERGYKLRAIANPTRAWQAAFAPLHRYLESIARRLPGNWQFDQEAGRREAQRLLREEKFACSIDLEGASDNIPLELQIFVLRSLGVEEEWCSLVEYCSQGMWLLPEEVKDLMSSLRPRDYIKWPHLRGIRSDYMQWLQGQPLGLKFSFNLFSITLGLMYEGVSYSLRNSDFTYDHDGKDCRRVQVGDDLVSFEKVESLMIRGLLQSVGIPVSMDKTIESTQLCEFTSRLITTKKIVSAPKWRNFDDDNFFDYARAYGTGVFWVYPWKWRRILYLLEDVPEWCGGLGWNSKGTDLWSREAPFRELADRQPIRPAVKLEAAGARARELVYKSVLAASPNFPSMIDISSSRMSDQDISDFVRRMVSADMLVFAEKFSAFDSLTEDIIQLLSLARDVAYDAGHSELEFITSLPTYLRSDYSWTLGYGESPSKAFIKSVEPLVRVEAPTKEARPVTKRRQLEKLIRLVGLG